MPLTNVANNNQSRLRAVFDQIKEKCRLHPVKCKGKNLLTHSAARWYFQPLVFFLSIVVFEEKSAIPEESLTGEAIFLNRGFCLHPEGE